MRRFLTWKWMTTAITCVILLLAIRFVLHLVLPRNFPESQSTITLDLEGGPLVCRYYNVNPPIKGVVVLGTGDGGWSYWEDNTAKSLSAHGYFVIGWDCRAFADSRSFDHEQLVDGFNAAVRAAAKKTGQPTLPVWYGGWSTGAEQSVAAAASSRRPASLRGLLLAAPGERGRYGLETSDLLGVMPTGPGSFALSDLADEIDNIRVAQFAAGLDPLDYSTWLEKLHVPYKIFKMPNSLHDMGGAGPEFQQTLLDAIDWTLSGASE